MCLLREKLFSIFLKTHSVGFKVTLLIEEAAIQPRISKILNSFKEERGHIDYELMGGAYRLRK